MINIIVATPKGEIINEQCNYIIVHGDNGELGILEKRLPVILKITNGFIKIVNDDVKFVAIINGVLDFENNIATVVSQNAAVEKSYEEAMNKILEEQQRIISENKRKNVNFVDAEKELAKNIKEAKASQIR